MASADVELEKQLKEAGKQLLHPPDAVEELLHVLDKIEKLLLRVDQFRKKSMLDALKPSMNALIKDSLLNHSDIDVKVAVASCISEITRITAPDAPCTDDQMRDVFQLIVSSFEDLADRSSRSYNKRASILKTVSEVRSCVIMLDLECDELIVKMFEHFLRAARDYHLDSIYSSMESIMVLVIDESEEISVEMLKPLLASVKKDHEGVLPVAHKLGKGVLLKSADKLKPYMMPALTSLGESLDMYHKVVAAVCEGTTANFENKDDNDESSVRSIKKPASQEVETASPSKSGSPPDETRVKKAGLAKNEGLTQEDTPAAQKQAGKKTAIAEEVKLTDTVNKSEDGEASSDSDAKLLKKSESKSKSTKQSGKKSNQSGKESDVGESDTKRPKQVGKNVDIKGDNSDPDCKPLRLFAKKSTSKKNDDGNKRGSGKTIAEKAQAKPLSGDDVSNSKLFF